MASGDLCFHKLIALIEKHAVYYSTVLFSITTDIGYREDIAALQLSTGNGWFLSSMYVDIWIQLFGCRTNS